MSVHLFQEEKYREDLILSFLKNEGKKKYLRKNLQGALLCQNKVGAVAAECEAELVNCLILRHQEFFASIYAY